MKRRTTHLHNPVFRAVAAKLWADQAIDAQIHAMLGADPQRMCNLAGRMFFTILGAAIAERMDAEDADIRILRGAINAVYDQVDQENVTDANRASIVSGLAAAKRISLRVKRSSIVDSHLDLEAKLRAGHVHMSDFDHLVERINA